MATNNNNAADGEEDGDEEDENFGKGSGSPPAFGTGADAFGDLANRPVKLTIESKPPQKSPYEKIFNVSS